ncbi:MAG: 4-hydroxy-3-methylbut-2-enyl diphosphate reductase [Akkermansia sp.]|nr:4-hydroxy-3-methylbut-2-enyl diphosphate reductase [Akkermansia sp.]
MQVKKPVNVRRREVLERIRSQVDQYKSPLVQYMRENGDVLHCGNTEVYLASSFGFCDGVKRAIEIAHAACDMFAGKRIWLIGEIIHNPVVNARLDAMGLRHLPFRTNDPAYDALTEEDVVIIPAFGVPVALRQRLESKGVQLVDSTCGNVMKVWTRVRSYAKQGITSVIHGKAKHEESMATASHSQGDDGLGNYIVIFSEAEAQMLVDYLLGRGDKATFIAHFAKACSPDFDPDVHLAEIGMANQTTMLKSETAHIQAMLRDAVTQRDGNDARFHVFDTICGATQDRQNALFELLEKPLDAMFIIGGYNSSNTTHLAHIAARRLPTFFVKSADCLLNLHEIMAYDLTAKEERLIPLPPAVADTEHTWRIGLTAGASCPDNVIEEVLRRIAALRGFELPAVTL